MWSKIKAAVGKVKTATHPKVSTGNILYFRNLLLISFNWKYTLKPKQHWTYNKYLLFIFLDNPQLIFFLPYYCLLLRIFSRGNEGVAVLSHSIKRLWTFLQILIFFRIFIPFALNTPTLLFWQCMQPFKSKTVHILWSPYEFAIKLTHFNLYF